LHTQEQAWSDAASLFGPERQAKRLAPAREHSVGHQLIKRALIHGESQLVGDGRPSRRCRIRLLTDSSSVRPSAPSTTSDAPAGVDRRVIGAGE